jgi:Rab GDP dissociation inhibitor|tara:strand:+ start:534 stop:785 length:252 start_codon:yes stop_codon:yes gene_type:complete
MGLFEKKRVLGFYKYLDNVELDKKETWEKANKKLPDLHTNNMAEVFKAYSLESNTIDFMGHAVALHTDDTYLNKPAYDTIAKL